MEQPIEVSVSIEVSEPHDGESIEPHEPASDTAGAEVTERAMENEGAGLRERAAATGEGAEISERAATGESAGLLERAELKAGAELLARAATAESAAIESAAEDHESAERVERATAQESAEKGERPRYVLGYPHVESPSHHLWEAQQAGWPDHLPHEAWRAMIDRYNKERHRASSADHPAFQAGYAPNYIATRELEEELQDTPRQRDRR